MKRLLRCRLFGVSFLAVAVLATPAIVDADGGDNTVIHACVNDNDGTLRIVDPNTSCKKNESPLHWPTVARIAVVETTVSALVSRVGSIESKDITQDSLLSGLVSRVSSIEAKDVNQDSLLSSLVSRVSNLESHDDSQDSRIASLLSRVSSLEAVSGLGTLCARSCQGSALALNFVTTDINGDQFCDPRPTYYTPCDPYTCLQDEDHPASCRTGCNEDSECTAGNVCSPSRECVPYVFFCSEDGNTLLGADGSTVDCRPYQCHGGTCLGRCSSGADCDSPDYVCNADGACVPHPW